MLNNKFNHKPVANPLDVIKIFKDILEAEKRPDQIKEHFWVLGLNNKNSIKFIDLISLGTMNCTLVSTREVYRIILLKECIRAVFIHNHPSGDPEPSSGDDKVTKKLVEAGKLLEIDVLDHIIITNENERYYSYNENNRIISFQQDESPSNFS